MARGRRYTPILNLFLCFTVAEGVASGDCEDSSMLHARAIVPAPTKRIAVFMSGSLQRYHLKSASQHFVAPLVKEGFDLDYFLALHTGDFFAWHSTANKYEPDPELGSYTNMSQLAQIIAEPLREAGATVQHIDLFDSVPLSREDLHYITGAHKGASDSGCTPPTSMWGVTGKITQHARQNFLQLHKKLDGLWGLAKAQEKPGKQYLYTVIVRDDAYWINDFSFGQLLRIGGDMKMSGNQGKVFNQLCDKTWGGLTDFIFIADRKASESILSWYSHMVRPCKYGNIWVKRARKLTNSETFGQALFEQHNLTVESVPPVLLPFQRVARKGGKLCLHKTCNGKLLSKGLDVISLPFTSCAR